MVRLLDWLIGPCRHERTVWAKGVGCPDGRCCLVCGAWGDAFGWHDSVEVLIKATPAEVYGRIKP